MQEGYVQILDLKLNNGKHVWHSEEASEGTDRVKHMLGSGGVLQLEVSELGLQVSTLFDNTLVHSLSVYNVCWQPP